MLLHVDLAGNSYVTEIDGQLVVMRPDWVDILLRKRTFTDPSGATQGVVGWEKAGYAYYHGGKGQTSDPVYFLPEAVAHFIDKPDPLATYRGMSWLTPVVREIQTDTEMNRYKLRYLGNAATPNLAVSLAKEVTVEQFEAFVDAMDEKHKGVDEAGRTLYTGGGADVTVIGASLKDLDLKQVQGFGETRLAQAAGVPPVVADMAEGLQGSSLNTGNFGQARRKFADTTLARLWGNAAGSLEVLVPAPTPVSRLWVDSRDIPFLREDMRDQAEILSKRMLTIESGVRAGFKPDTVTAAVVADDLTLMKHTGLFSVQLQPPMTEQQASATGDAAASADEVADEPATV
jgi:phage portal protein BeeE